MEESRKRKNATRDENIKADRLDEPSYPPTIEKMSEEWRSIQRQNLGQQRGGFVERNYLTLGIGIGLLIVALLIVIGGFAFLVWNAR